MQELVSMEIFRQGSAEMDRFLMNIFQRNNNNNNNNNDENNNNPKKEDCCLQRVSLIDGNQDEEGRVPIPLEHGLMLRLDNSNGHVYVEHEKDEHYEQIHPNCFAPASLSNVCLLKGGGSGTAVFKGDHRELGTVIMKHASHRDTEEVMSLALIGRQLLRRGEKQEEAAAFLKSRIPQLLFCYISPQHVRDRALELWGALRGTTLRRLTQELKDSVTMASTSLGEVEEESETEDEEEDNPLTVSSPLGSSTFQLMKQKVLKRDLFVCRSENQAKMEVHTGQFILHLPNLQDDGVMSSGYDFLESFTGKLAKQQERRAWKCTLAQTNVGGPSSENGATVLVSGRLKNHLLEATIQDFVKVMNYLRLLTLPHERHGIDSVRAEVKRLEAQKDPDPDDVSKATNEFVGTAVRKNFSRNGRFPALREFGAAFREQVFLTDDEKLPAKFLGLLLEQGRDMSDIFVDPPSRFCVLDCFMGKNSWIDVLRLATSFDSNKVNDCIWTAGLTDAGLHNSYVDEEIGLHLFDLGTPQLMPMTAFLTKLLMSFFHTLGMEESSDGSWVIRFEEAKEKLALTRKTKSLMPHIHKTFEYAMKHMIDEVFEGEERVRELLLTYTILQLLSDGAFCLARWEEKGGGRARVNERNTTIGKWLWRAIWDLYVASDVYEKLLLPIQQKNMASLN